MKSFPLPATIAALTALLALPFSAAAAGTLFMTAALGGIIHTDYVLRSRRLRPSLAPLASVAVGPLGTEDRALAA
jgi:uncharacterized membrane protein